MKAGAITYAAFLFVSSLILVAILKIYDGSWSWLYLMVLLPSCAIPAAAAGAAERERKRDPGRWRHVRR